jgi:hypothetical protein
MGRTPRCRLRAANATRVRLHTRAASQAMGHTAAGLQDHTQKSRNSKKAGGGSPRMRHRAGSTISRRVRDAPRSRDSSMRQHVLPCASFACVSLCAACWLRHNANTRRLILGQTHRGPPGNLQTAPPLLWLQTSLSQRLHPRLRPSVKLQAAVVLEEAGARCAA